MSESLPEIVRSTSRRGILKGIAAAGVGAVAGRLATGGQVLAQGDPRISEAPSVPESGRPAAVTIPAFQSYMGLDLHPLTSTTGYAFNVVPLYWTGGGDPEFTLRLQLPQASVINTMTFYVVNSTAAVCTSGLYRIDALTGSLVAPVYTMTATPSTPTIQAVSIPLPSGGIAIDNTSTIYWLYWNSTSATTGQELVSARLSYTPALAGTLLLPAPVRVVDTRVSSGPIGGASGPLANGSFTDFTIAGANGIPANATAVFGNLTAVEFSPGNGYMSLYPSGAPTPNTSSINFGGGEPNQLANFFQVALGTGASAGKVRLYVSGTSTNAIIDVAGYVV